MARRLPSLSFSVLQNRDFRFLLLARLCFYMAQISQAVIVGWQIYTLTRDPLMLGLTGLAEALPALVCALFAGHIVDVGRPHRIYLACFGFLSLNTVMLLLLAGGFVAPPGGDVVPWIFLGIFLSGIAGSFSSPANFSLFPQVVPRRDLSAGAAWMSSNFQFASIAAPALAGLVYGGYGPRIAWFIPAGLLIAGFVMLASLSTAHRHYRSAKKNEPAAESIRQGWRFILKSPVIIAVMALDMFAVFFGGAVAMLPVYADQILHVGSEGLGVLRASTAVGAIVMALALAVRPMQCIRGSTLLWVVAGFGVSIIAFGLSANFYLSLLFLAASGAFDSVSMVIRSMILQLLTPDTMRGRVSSINNMFITSSNELGAFESGVGAKLLGLVPSVVFGGLMTLGIVAVTAFFTPQLRRMKIDALAKE